MNLDQKKALNHYYELVDQWDRTNPEMARCGKELILLIESSQLSEMRQEVKAANWQSLLSGFPTEAIQAEILRRFSVETIIASDLSVCPMCGIAPTIRKEEKGYEIFCDQCRDTTFFFDSLTLATLEWEQNCKNKLAEKAL